MINGRCAPTSGRSPTARRTRVKSTQRRPSSGPYKRPVCAVSGPQPQSIALESFIRKRNSVDWTFSRERGRVVLDRTRAVSALRLPSLTGDMSPSYSWNGQQASTRQGAPRIQLSSLDLIHGGGQPVTCRERCSRPNKHERCGGQHLLKPVAIRRDLSPVISPRASTTKYRCRASSVAWVPSADIERYRS